MTLLKQWFTYCNNKLSRFYKHSNKNIERIFKLHTHLCKKNETSILLTNSIVLHTRF